MGTVHWVGQLSLACRNALAYTPVFSRYATTLYVLRGQRAFISILFYFVCIILSKMVIDTYVYICKFHVMIFFRLYISLHHFSIETLGFLAALHVHYP